MTKLTSQILSIAFCIALSSVVSFGQTELPITKEDFIRSVKLGKKEGKTATWFVDRVNKLKVDFLVTRREKQNLRRYGGYLGQSGLDDLIIALRVNYQAKERPSSSSAIDNRITDSPIVNSPGSIQAPGAKNVTIDLTRERRITPEQRYAIISVLREHKPEVTIYVITVGDRESRNYAEQIAQTVHSAGWHVEGVIWAQVIGAYGVQCNFADPEINKAIMLAFTRAGIKITGNIDVPYNPYPNAILIAQQ